MSVKRCWSAATLVAATLLIVASYGRARAEAPHAIRIGYAISLTGANAAAAFMTQFSVYRMWAHEVNTAGGIMLTSLGGRLPVELVEYDDRSMPGGALRGLERLVNQDRVDFVLPPWGTATNLAVGQFLHDSGYPHLMLTGASDRTAEYVKLWPNCFWMLGTMNDFSQTLADLLARLRDEGKIGDRVAMLSVADQFGIIIARPARRAFKKAKLDLVYDRTYPVGALDLRPILIEVAEAHPDAFIAFSYPTDTVLLAEQAREIGFNPPVFYTSIGTSHPPFMDRLGSDIEGVMGAGGANPDMPEARDFVRRYREEVGTEPDHTGSLITYAGLQMLQQAIERVGAVDRAAVIKELQTGSFKTILGPIKLEDNVRKDGWWVGQWQHGEFYGIAPGTRPGSHQPEVPKPPWHLQ
jgi:branched-chain amino acid transport system substrate-binding protein